MIRVLAWRRHWAGIGFACVWTFVLGPPDELLGAGSFALNLRAAFAENDAFGVHAAADALVTAVSTVQGAAITGAPYIAPQQTWDYTDRITMLAPLSRSATANRAWRASLYTEEMPITATWGPIPSEQVVISDTFAFVREHSWDEFIGEWYTGPLTPTVGTWCYYSPPSLVIDENAESLTLDLADAGDGAVALSWSEAESVDPVAYWVFAKGPLNVERELIAVLEPDVFEFRFADLDAGQHRFLVAAVDGENVVIAKTEIIDYVVERNSYIYLPLVTAP